MKILATILTYNRYNLLMRCVNFIKSQTYKDFDLFVINNGSTDQTESFLLKNKIKYKNIPKTGSAAGWYECFEVALKGNYTHIWMMDDDGYPSLEALKELVSGIENNICVSSLLVNENHHNHLVFSFKDKNFRNINKANQIKASKVEHVHFFNGCLINLDLIKRKNLINKDYYHHGVEVDFLFKIKKYGKIATLKKSIHFHPAVNKRNIGNLWVYYYLRNSIIIACKYNNKNIFVALFGYTFLTYIRILQRNGIRDFFSYLIGKNFKLIYLAFINGFLKKYDNRIT